jgi:hypothetical protein
MMAVQDPRRDAEHLTLLSVAYYVVSALTLAWALVPLFHVGFGTWVVRRPETFGLPATGQTRLVGGLLIAIAATWLVLALALSVTLLLLARSLARRRRYVFCLVAAGVTAALCVPLGTILGILTIVVLLRPSVKDAFGRPPGPAPVVSL